jgi:hypothetical protein
VKDAKVGDIVTLYYERGKDNSSWVVNIKIHVRDNHPPPPLFRTHEELRKISFQLNYAREQRLKAKEAAEKK